MTTYTYDKVGNRTAMTRDGQTTAYTYNGLNQLVEADTPDAIINYTYDGRGNQITEYNGMKETTTAYTYAVTGEMTGMTVSSGDITTFTQENQYNHEGIRISKTESGVTRRYYYDNGIVAYTKDGATVSSANLLSGNGDILGSYRGEDYYVYTKDVQNSSESIIKEDGSLAAAYSYSDFGETEELTGSGFDNEICYTGAVYDAASGLYYMNARYYDPANGRFISQDTYRGELDDPGQWHLYVYCANNPINYVDPSGHDFIFLTSTKGACRAGHSALLIWYSGYWRYYSWEGDGYASTHAQLKKITQGVKNGKVYNSINNDPVVKRPEKKPYDKYFYISAGSVDAYRYAKEIMNEKHYREYSLTTRNCAWVATDILKRGNIGSTKREKLNNILYKYVTKNGKKYKVIRTLIPNTADDKVAKVFGTSVKNIL